MSPPTDATASTVVDAADDEDVSGLLTDVRERFRHWLYLPDSAALLVVLGAVAANYLPGDPVWCGIIAPPSSAKTEILNAIAGLPHVHAVATVTPAALLSGTSKKERAAGAKGGLLRGVGDFGILLLKDFGSILSIRPDARAELLAALRELFDGSWTRHVGSDGGQSLSWSGKLGLVFGSTPALDTYTAVVNALGERFLLCRMPPVGREQARRALDHAGASTAIMRRELAESVGALFAAPRREPRPLSEKETRRLVRVAALAVRIRSTVERDRFSREILAVHGAEGPARLTLTLDRLLAGLDSLGCGRTVAMELVERVAMDSTPPIRRRAFDYVREQSWKGVPVVETKAVALALDLPTTTTHRALEDLAAYGLTKRERQRQGHADLWALGDIEGP